MAAMCPCCGKVFGSFVDYPAVYVSEVSRLVIPNDIALPYFHDPYPYAIPKEVEGEFAGRRKIGSRFKRLFKRPDGPVGGLGGLGESFEYKGSVWVDSEYGVACFNRDERGVVLDQLDSYVKGLENVVDSVVTPYMLVPKLKAYAPELLFEIPGSGYCLAMGMQTLYSLGWLESQGVDLDDGDLAVRISGCGGIEDVRKLLMENVYKELSAEQEGVPDGYECVGLYIVGLRPGDTSTVRGLMSGERFRMKFAEFVFQGQLNALI